MGLHNRTYWRDDEGGRGYVPGGGITFGMPKPGRVVKWLLIINVVVFVAQLLFSRDGWMEMWFGARVGGWWQVWRYVTCQFLHNTHTIAGSLDPWHIGLNMLGLYMLGTPLEQQWGSRRFLRFYLSCGAVAGIAYVVISALVMHGIDWRPLIGASGGVYAILLAAAVLFPHFKLIFFLFPVPIRFAAVVIFGFMALTVVTGFVEDRFGCDFWSHVAHLGGGLASAVYLWVLPRFRGAVVERQARARSGAWERKMRSERRRQEEIDAILAKIQEHGIGSLSARERRTLQDATQRQRDRDREIRQM